MNKIISLIIYASVICFTITGCKKSDDTRGSIYFERASWNVNVNETLALKLKVKHGNESSNYDKERNPFKLVWSYTDEGVISVSQAGVITGKAAGSAFVKAESQDGKYSASTEVVVSDDGLTSKVSESLSNDLIYSKGIYLIRNSVMQCFDIDSKGTIFYDQLGGLLAHVVFVIKGEPNQPFTSSMQLKYFGHGTNIAVEEDGEERYIWVNSNGNKKADGSYGNSITFSRVKYVPNSVVENYIPGETYYLPNKTNIHPALDVKNDILAVTTSGGGDPLRYFYIYKLSEAKGLPETQVELPPVKFGGEESGVPEQTVSHNIKVKNLSQLTPIASFSVPPGKIYTLLNSYYFQGFDVADGKIYFYEGEGNGNDITRGASNAFMTVIDCMSGKVIGRRTRVGAISNLSDLEKFGITATGYMEAEGIKMHDGNLYLGFASRSTDNKRRANIFVYKK